MRPSPLLALSGLVLASCVSSPFEAGGPEEYQGVIGFGFESSYFGPCGVDEDWWLEGPVMGELTGRYGEARAAGVHDVFARVRGTLSPRGRYGHMGGSDRALSVEEVLEVRARRPTDCPDAPVEVAPRSADLAVGDTLRLLAAAFTGRREIPGARILWSSSDPSLASVDSLGRVVGLRPGRVEIAASHGGARAISVVRVAPASRLTGYAVLRGTVTNADGSPFAAGEVFFSCGPGAWGHGRRTDSAGRYRFLLQPPDYAPYPFPEDRTLPCRITAAGPTPPRVTTYAAVRFALPGRAVDTTVVNLVRKPRGEWLSVRPDTATLLPGESLRLEALADGRPDREVTYRSIVPSVAGVDPQGVVTAVAQGTAVIVATSTRDTTVYAASVISIPPHGPRMVLESITREGAPADTSRARGTLELNVKLSLAAELAPARVELRLDDQPVTSHPVAAGFQRLTLRLDTTRFANGPHSLVVVLLDAGGREVEGWRFPVTIAN